MNTTNNNNVPNRLSPGLTTTAPFIGNLQDERVKCDTEKTNDRTKKQRLISITTFGTWNVRSLRSCGRLEELANELDRYRWNIIGLSETRWSGNGEVITQHCHKFIYSGLDKKHMQGVAFLVNKELTNSILNITIVSSRIISIRIQAIPFNCPSLCSNK